MQSPRTLHSSTVLLTVLAMLLHKLQPHLQHILPSTPPLLGSLVSRRKPFAVHDFDLPRNCNASRCISTRAIWRRCPHRTRYAFLHNSRSVARYINGFSCNKWATLQTNTISDIYGNGPNNGRGGLQKDPKAYLRYSSDADIVGTRVFLAFCRNGDNANNNVDVSSTSR